MNPSNKNISRVLLLAAISVISLAFVFRNNHANQPGVRKNNPTGSIPQTAVPGSGRPLGQHLQNRVKIAVPNPARQAGPLQPAGNAISNAPTRLTAYLASRQAGVIGLYDGNQSDNPADNIFSVTLDYQPTVNDKVWLTYRLAGVDENSGVACSVNDRLAFGGYLVKTDTATRRQRIQLNAAWMQKGENRIQFGLPEKADYGYRVSDLALEVEQGSNDAPVAVTTSRRLYNGKAWVHGFVADNKTRVTLDGKELAVRNGEFETIITPADKKQCELKASVHGAVFSRSLHWDEEVKADREYALDAGSATMEKIFAKNQLTVLKTPEVTLQADKGSVAATKLLSVTPLRPIDLPAMDLGMTNVTAENKGFRFLPHGEHFANRPATVSLKYDRTKIPDGYTENDIRSYYFDPATKHWVALERDTVDKTLCMVVSKTTHFTDMINGVIKTPESPQTEGFAPTMMNDIKAADPTSKIELIAPPTANNQGSANLSYPIELPPARNGMSPNLAITYNSDGGSGWLGEGWDLNIPSITVDTRWGVPRYDPNFETETYTMGGTMLATVISPTGSNAELGDPSVSHRGVLYPRQEKMQFHPVVEGGFSRIVRMGKTPSDYYWTVTDKKGTKYLYGATTEDGETNNSSTGAILSGNVTSFKYVDKNTATTGNTEKKDTTYSGIRTEWKLSQVIDLNGYFQQYYYKTVEDTIGGGVVSRRKELDFILVGQKNKFSTSTGGDLVFYKVKFASRTRKAKKLNNGRYGFLASGQNTLLDSITVWADTLRDGTKKTFDTPHLVRSYAFKYKEGAFKTELLGVIEQLDDKAKVVSSHALDYYNHVSDVKNPVLYDSGKDVTYRDLVSLGNGHSVSDGWTAYLGVGFQWGPVSAEVGYQHGFNRAQSYRDVTVMDLNGDGLPDRVSTVGSTMKFAPNNGLGGFGEERIIESAPAECSYTESKSYSDGWQGDVGVKMGGVGVCVNAGMDWSSTYSRTYSYFQDVNNDGLVDIVNRGKVYFNHITMVGNDAVPGFDTLSSVTPNPIKNIKTVVGKSNVFKCQDPIKRSALTMTKEQLEVIKRTPVQDLVRVWEAPYDGTISISGRIKLLQSAPGSPKSDGVVLRVQHNDTELVNNIYHLVSENDTANLSDMPPLVVHEKDKVYFRLQCGSSILCDAESDVVSFQPEIKYGSSIAEFRKDGQSATVYKPVEANFVNKVGYNLIDTIPYQIRHYIPSSPIYPPPPMITDTISPIRLQGTFTKKATSDDVTLSVYTSNDQYTLRDSVVKAMVGDTLNQTTYRVKSKNMHYKVVGSPIWQRTFPADSCGTYTMDYLMKAIPYTTNKMQLVISSPSNINWSDVEWNPQLKFNTYHTNDTIIYPGVKYNMFNKVLKASPLLSTGTWTSTKVVNGNRGDAEVTVIPLPPNMEVTVHCEVGLQSNNNSSLQNKSFVYKIVDVNGNTQFTRSGLVSSDKISVDGQFTCTNDKLRSIVYIDDTLSRATVVSMKNTLTPTPQVTKVVDNIFQTREYTVTGTFNNPDKVEVLCHRTVDEMEQGPMWRGWGQFEYNCSSEDRFVQALDINHLYIPKDTADTCMKDPYMYRIVPEAVRKKAWQGVTRQIFIQGDTLSTGRINMESIPSLATAGGGGGGASMVKRAPLVLDASNVFFREFAVPKVTALRQYVVRSLLSALGSATPSAPSATVVDDVEDPSLFVVNTAPTLGTNSTSTTFWGGASVKLGVANPGLSGSKSSGSSTTVSAFTDMNGDGYPDYITDNQVEYSNARGSRDGEKLTFLNETTKNDSWSLGISGGFSRSESPNSGGQKMVDIAKQTAYLSENPSPSLSVGASYVDNNDHATSAYIDINGDGLPDRLFQDAGGNYKVCLNLGYKFMDEAVDYGLKNIQSGTSHGFSFNVGVGVDAGVVSGGKGRNTSTTTATTLFALRDMNGDGLADQLRVGKDSKCYIRYNKGNGFDDTELQASGIDFINETESKGSSDNVNFRVTIPIWLIKITAGGSTSIGTSTDYISKEIQDIDGDGFPDLLSLNKPNFLDALLNHETNSVNARLSRIACTNKLKGVTNPLGGSFTMDYRRSASTTDHPGGKWIMSSVQVNDGVDDDGKALRDSFEYAGGKYDRYDREFLGFAKVKVLNINTDKDNRTAYRSTEQRFDTDNYYTKGLLLGTTVFEGDGSTGVKRTQTDNEYYAFGVSRYIQDGPNKGKFGMAPGLDLGFNRRVKRQFIVYSPMRYTSSRLYESAGSMPTGAAYFSYNTVAGTGGEPTAYKFDDAGGLDHDGNGGFKYRAETEYVDVYSLPRKHTVYDKGGHIMRQVYAVWDPLFSDHLLKVKNVIAPGDTAVTDIGYYDSKGGGGICRIILPKNGNAANNTSTRMSYTYTYDPLFHQYLTEVKDTLGYSSTLGDYNYKYGTACKHTDINGNVMTTKLDNLGRVVSITGPNELAAGRSYTLQFEYHPELKDASGNAQKPYAITRHYDPANSSGSTINNIETVTFVDGVGRAIQVKKSGVIGTTPVMIVSGRAKYDAFGRVKAAYYPIAETDNSLKYVFNATFDSTASQIPSARTAYDVLDRVLLTKLPDGTSTQMSYAIDNGLLKTTVLDALGNKQESYANGSGKTVKTIQYNKGVKDSLLTTLFHYDAIDRTDTVTDTKGKKTVTTYDWLDRRTRLVHPASGTTNFGYDASGNQAWVQPANLISTGKKIQYFYTYNRLDSVVYPNHPENNVKYVYGGYDNTQNLNLKGHLKSIEDGSGKQEFKYGKMGEVTEVKRTLVIPNQAVATYTTSTVYDSWNRLLSMTYPDGEVVNYTYNTAGLLTGVASSANTYVSNIKYDKFEQRTYMKYGNGAETYYAYNDSNRTLTGLSVKSTLLSGQPTLMSNAYTYDRVKNVVSVINSGTAVAAANTLSGSIGGTMEHTYKYDNLYRLVEAHGDYNKANTDKNAHYDLFMGYDAMHNVISKRQEINQKGVQFAGGLNAGCNFKYTINSNNCQQISNIADSSYRYASGEQKKVDAKVRQYSYDANGNLISINIGTQTTDGKLMASKSRKMLWDEENRLLAISDNGYVSNYWYDASGERTVKMSGDGEGVLVNGILSGARTGTTNFTAYISPYLVVGNGGNYTKHIYMGSQRITSKVSNSGIFTTSPVTTGLKSKYDMLTAKIKERYDSLGVTYKGTPQSGGLVSSSPTTTANSYFYHSDHLGSSSLITDPTGAIVQHIEYVPFGEIFVNERNSSWQTPYLFNAKERDDETGLTYYGARYYDSEGVNWWSTDPQKFDAPNFGSYVYCFDSPVVYVDPNGKYGVNIHYVMTYNSLLMLGSSKQNADLIAHYSGTYADHPSQSVLDNFNPQSYNQYRNGIDYSKTANSQNEDQSVRHSMMSNAEANHMSESGALSRGLSYGWDNVFQAGNENGFSSLGVGLHALHDAFAHKGAKTSDHLGKNLSSAGMLYVDQFGNAASNSVGGDAQVITRSAIISYGLLKGDNSYIQNAYKKGLTGLLFEGMSKEQFEIISKKANAAGFYFKQFENTNHYSLKKIGE